MNTIYFKQKLEEEKKELLNRLNEISKYNEELDSFEAVPENTEHETDPNDLADHFESYEERSDLVRTFEARYKEVIEAIEKIKKGTYGKCEVSGLPIEQERLEANPAAKTCIAYMNK